MANQKTNTSSLKDGTRGALLLIILSNIAVFYLAVKTGSLMIGGVTKVIENWQQLMPAGISLIFAGIFNELLNSSNKARLVFLRWRSPLPGSEAFTKHALEDARIDIAALERKQGPLPVDQRDQNVLWYRLYQTVADKPAVLQVHRNYLFTRDYAVASFILAATLGIAGFWMIPSPETAQLYVALLVLQYLAVRQAAKNHGIRLVTTVLAIKAAE